MFNDRLTTLLATLEVKNYVIAEYSGINHTILSRYKTGKRIPKKNGNVINALIGGVIRYADDRSITERLYKLLENDGLPADETNLSEGIHEWLYADIPAFIPKKLKKKVSESTPADTSFSVFADRLGKVMNLTGLSNAELARLINIDSSQISRYRKGHRTPKNNMGIIISICQVIMEQTEAKGLQKELVKMISAPHHALKDEDILFIYLRNWLCGFQPDDNASIGQLLRHMNSYTPISTNNLPPFESIATDEVLNDTALYYTGNTGLQSAVIRFLATAITSGAKELLLYSDQSMDWLTKDQEFQAKWISLMIDCVKCGMRIKIIHNIERDINEMTDAIRSWLPLYMSGMIEPYYCTSKNGSRFSHTIFLCPDVACIEACIMNGCEESAIYQYHTDNTFLDYHEQSFSSMLRCCRPLVRMQTDKPSDNYGTTFSSDEYSNILITVKKASVVVSRTAPPFISFVFTHPLMYEAFALFVKL